MKNSGARLWILVIFILTSYSSFTQTIASQDAKLLRQKEDSLKQIARYMILDSISSGRLLAYKDFVPTFLRALKVKNSFYYPFDSVLGISKLYSPDSTFRIFTWYLEVDDYLGYQKGFIQMKTRDGSLKGFTLFDNSEYSEYPNDDICRDTTWIGAVYYDIIKTEYNGKKYYTLFGIDRYSVRSTKKWIEVLTFDQKGEPVFGGPFFTFDEDSVKRKPMSRYSIEYKKNTRTLVDYVPDLEMILVDHLISDPDIDEPDNPWTFIPDGDYEGFKWQKGKWVHVDKVFTFKLEDGQAPVVDPILDFKGNKNEEKLKEKSDANKVKKSGGN